MFPLPWAILGVVLGLLACSIGGYEYRGRIDADRFNAVMAQQKADAEAVVAQKNEESAAKDAAVAELTVKLDEAHETAQEAIQAVEADYSNKFADLLRKSHRPACGGELSIAAPSAGVPAGSAAGSQDRLPEGVGKALDEIARGFSELGANANKESADIVGAVDWAKGVGR